MGSKSSKAQAKAPAAPVVPQAQRTVDSSSSSSSRSGFNDDSARAPEPLTTIPAAAAPLVPVYVAPPPPPFFYKGREIIGFPDRDSGEFIVEVGMFGRPYWMSPERISQQNLLTAIPAVPDALERIAMIRAESIGEIIDEYPLGKGAFKPNCEGFIDNNGPMALLRLELDLSDKDDLGTLSQLLAFLALAIQHPNLNPATQLCAHKRGFLLVSPLCLSSRLEDIVRRERLTEPEMAYILTRVLLGLHYLHSRGLAHTDVSSNRVYFARNTFEVRLQMEFASLACAWHDKSDIWAVGITLYEMLEGEPPHADLHPMRTLFLIPKADPPIPKHPDRWSAELLSFLAVCLQKDPSLRPSAEALLEHPFIAKACSREEFRSARRSCLERSGEYGSNHLSLKKPQKLA